LSGYHDGPGLTLVAQTLYKGRREVSDFLGLLSKRLLKGRSCWIEGNADTSHTPN